MEATAMKQAVDMVIHKAKEICISATTLDAAGSPETLHRELE